MLSLQIEVVKGMPGHSSAEYRAQPRAGQEPMAEAREERGAERENEPRVGNLERQLYPGGILNPNDRNEPLQNPQRQRKRLAGFFEPRKGAPVSLQKDGPQASFVGQQPGARLHGDGHGPIGREERHEDVKYMDKAEAQKGEYQHRGSAQGYSVDRLRPSSGRGDERDCQRKKRSSMDAEKGSRYSEENGNWDDDGLDEAQRYQTRFDPHFPKNEDFVRRISKHGSPETISDEEKEPRSQRGSDSYGWHQGDEPRRAQDGEEM